MLVSFTVQENLVFANFSVFERLPGSSASKESACNAGDLGWEDLLKKGTATSVLWPGEFHGLYSAWGRKELDTTERLSISLPLHFSTTWEAIIYGSMIVNMLIAEKNINRNLLAVTVLQHDF